MYFFNLVTLRADVEAESHEKLEKLRKEKEEVEEKLVSKKRDMKEAEQTFIKQKIDLEREMALLSEKLKNSETSKKEMQESYEKEIASLSSFSQNIKGDHQKELEDYFKTTEALKLKVQSLTTELLETKSSLENGKHLWQHKIEHLEAQRLALRQELQASQKNYETTVANMQQKQQEEKDAFNKDLNEKISKLESKHQQIMNDSNEKHNLVYSQLFNSNKELEKENKNLKVELDLKTKSHDPTKTAKLIEDLNEQLDRLKSETDQLKKSNLQKNNEIRSQMEKEKDVLKTKNQELEAKLKEIESKRSHGMFEVEIEKSKWASEKEGLNNQINHFKEEIEDLKQENKKLIADISKLKNEKPKQRILPTSRGGGISSSGIGSKIGNPYSNFITGGSKLGGLEKILDDVNDTSQISTSGNIGGGLGGGLGAFGLNKSNLSKINNKKDDDSF